MIVVLVKLLVVFVRWVQIEVADVTHVRHAFLLRGSLVVLMRVSLFSIINRCIPLFSIVIRCISFFSILLMLMLLILMLLFLFKKIHRNQREIRRQRARELHHALDGHLVVGEPQRLQRAVLRQRLRQHRGAAIRHAVRPQVQLAQRRVGHQRARQRARARVPDRVISQLQHAQAAAAALALQQLREALRGAQPEVVSGEREAGERGVAEFFEGCAEGLHALVAEAGVVQHEH